MSLAILAPLIKSGFRTMAGFALGLVLTALGVASAHAADPVARWVADDWAGGSADWVDRIGGKIAVAYGSPVKSTGQFGGVAASDGIAFDGLNDYFEVTAGNNPIATRRTVTIVALFKATQGATGTDGAHWQFPGPINAEAPGGPNDFGLTVGADGAAHAFFNENIPTGTPVPVIDGRPHTLILTWSDDSGADVTARLYVDGVLKGTLVTDGGDGIVSDLIRFGRERETSNRWFRGTIGELRFYASLEDPMQLHRSMAGPDQLLINAEFTGVSQDGVSPTGWTSSVGFVPACGANCGGSDSNPAWDGNSLRFGFDSSAVVSQTVSVPTVGSLGKLVLEYQVSQVQQAGLYAVQVDFLDSAGQTLKSLREPASGWSAAPASAATKTLTLLRSELANFDQIVSARTTLQGYQSPYVWSGHYGPAFGFVRLWAEPLSSSQLLNSIAEDVNDAENMGTPVSMLYSGVIKGIAVTGIDTGNGFWHYSTDGGANWASLSGVSSSSARLLKADSLHRIRFTPNPNYNGTATIQYRAWDQVVGTDGALLDLTTTGGGAWALVAYGANASLGGFLNAASGNFSSSLRTGSAVLPALSLLKSSSELAMSWTVAGGGFPVGGIDSYSHAIAFPLPQASAMSFDGTGTSPPDFHISKDPAISFAVGSTHPDQSLVPVRTLTGSPGMPTLMYLRNKSFGAGYGGVYGLVMNDGSNPALDYGQIPDDQMFKAIYLDHGTGSDQGQGLVMGGDGGAQNSYVPSTMALWVWLTEAQILSLAGGPVTVSGNRSLAGVGTTYLDVKPGSLYSSFSANTGIGALVVTPVNDAPTLTVGNPGNAGLMSATGGTTVASGIYTVHKFLTSGTFTPERSGSVEVLLVGGGGGGGPMLGGGGGGGAVIHMPAVSLLAGTVYSIEVGAGGTSGMNGNPTVAFGASAAGGGSSGSHDSGKGFNGGSGGGAASNNSQLNQGGASSGSSLGPNAGTIHGNRGGNMTTARVAGPTRGAGGGGAGAPGKDTDPNITGDTGPTGDGSGGPGILNTILGQDYYWGGGGGGGAYVSQVGGYGGLGGGGGGGGNGGPGIGGSNALTSGAGANGLNGGAGGANTGGGGGGGAWDGGQGGTGGSGIAIIRYQRSPLAYLDSVASDYFTEKTGQLVGADSDPNTVLLYGVVGGSVTEGISSKTGAYGTFKVDVASGTYTYMPDASKINALGAGAVVTDNFTVSVSDSVVTNPTTAVVLVDVVGANDAPTLTTVGTFTGAVEDTDYAITYEALAAAANEADPDGPSAYFRVDGVTSGTLKKNGVAVTSGSTLVGPGESMVWRPASNASGTLAAFTVRAWDGGLASAEAVPVFVVVSAVNDTPQLMVSEAGTLNASTLKASTGATEDGVYALYLNGVSTPVYCLMNDALAGGGWMLAMKGANTGSTFNYSSPHWTTTSTLNTDATRRNDTYNEDAKFEVFNSMPATEILVIFPEATPGGAFPNQSYGFIWKESMPTPANTAAYLGRPIQGDYTGKTLRELFAGGEKIFIRDAVSATPYRAAGSGVFSTQADVRFFGFNYVSTVNNNRARFGFGWNENGGGLYPMGFETSNDVSGGLGLDRADWSAGDILGCCADSIGMHRQMKFELYVRGSSGFNSVLTEDVPGNLLFDSNLIDDPDSDSLTVTLSVPDGSITANPSNGIQIGGTPQSRTISGSRAGLNTYVSTAGNLIYLGAQDNSSDRTLTLEASDGNSSSKIALILHFLPSNDVPVASDQSVSTAEDAAVAIVLAGTDVEGSALTYTVVTPPTKGALSGTAPNLTYTPNANVSGTDTFTFKVNDGAADSAVATVAITISAVNDAPVAASAILTAISEDMAPADNPGTVVSALANAGTDADTGAMKGIAVTAVDASHGAWQFSVDGGVTWATLAGVSETSARLLKGNDPNHRIRFLPWADYNGTATITYRAWDQTAGADSPLANGLLAWIPFENTLNDAASGASHVGTWASTVGGFAAAVPSGVGAGSYSGVFNGSSTRVDLANSADLNVNTGVPFTMSAWIRTSFNDTAQRVILAKALSGASSANHTAALFVDSAGRLRYDNFYVSAVSSTASVRTGQWVHVAVTYDGTTYWLYVGGQASGSSSFAGSNESPGTWTFSIGQSLNSTFPGGSFQGNIDEVGFWSRALSANEVSILASGGISTGASVLPGGGSAAFSANVGTGSVAVTPVNDKPTQKVPQQIVMTEDVTGNIVFPQDPFGDVDGDSLTVGLSIQDGTIQGQPVSGITLGGTPQSITVAGTVAALNAYFNTPGNLTYRGAPDNTANRVLTTRVSDGSAPAMPPVTGYARWFDASKLSLADGASVTRWPDGSGIPADAITISGKGVPKYVKDAGTGSGLGVVSFQANEALGFTRDSAIRSVFSVFKGSSFLLTDLSSYHFHRPTDENPNDPLWVGYSSGFITGGSTYVNGALVNGSAFAMPTDARNGFNLVSVLTTGPVSADSFNRDRVYHSGIQSHAEVILYDRVLTEAERVMVENYLSAKWFKTGPGVGEATTSTVTFIPVNDAPTLTSVDLLTGAMEDTDFTLSYDALAAAANEADIDNAPIAFRIESLSSGTLTRGGVAVTVGSTLLSSGEALVWRPAPNANGELEAFSVKAWDGALASAAAIPVRVAVSAVNDAPVAIAQSVTVAEDTAKAIMLAGTDVEGMPLVYAVVTPPTKGTLSGTAPNLTYTPNADANGTDSFSFEVNDGSADSAAAEVSITITPVNDAPVAVSQSVITDEDTAKTITLSGTDVEGSALTYRVVTPPTKGALSGTAPNLTYTPNANANGTDSFSFKVNDGSADSAAAEVSITITPVNDAPVLNVPGAQTAEESTDLTFNVEVSPTVIDPDGTPISLRISVVHGTVAVTLTEGGASVSAGSNDSETMTLLGAFQQLNEALSTLRYRSVAEYSGTDTITFEAVDDGGLSATATIDVSVESVDNQPIAVSQNLQTPEDESLRIVLEGTDPEGQPLEYFIMAEPEKGSLRFDGTLVFYTPHPDATGIDRFTFRVNDGRSDSAPGTVTVEILPVNDAPRLSNVSVIDGAVEDTVLNLSHALLLGLSDAHDVDADPVSFRLETLTIGTLTQGGQPVQPGDLLDPTGQWVWAPPENHNGTIEAFTVVAWDGTEASTLPVTVMVNVRPEGDAPSLVRPQAVSVDEDTTLSFVEPFAIRVSDPDSPMLILNLAVRRGMLIADLDHEDLVVKQGGSGSSSMTLEGSSSVLNAVLETLRYRGDAEYSGDDELEIFARDPSDLVTLARVPITVVPVDDPPTIAEVVPSVVGIDPVTGTVKTQLPLRIPLSILVDALPATASAQVSVVSGDSSVVPPDGVRVVYQQGWFLEVTRVTPGNQDFQSVPLELTVTDSHQLSASQSVNLVLQSIPRIRSGPAGGQFALGGTVRLSVDAVGGLPLSFGWYRNGVLIRTTETPTLELPSAGAAAAGRYSVRVSNLQGEVESPTVTVELLEPPRFVSRPVSAWSVVGGGARFQADAAGGGQLVYEWYRRGVLQYTGRVWNRDALSLADSGSYELRVRNAVASVRSGPIFLTVSQPRVEPTGWGDNSVRQITFGGAWTNLVSVAAGGRFTVGLRTNGSVVATGAIAPVPSLRARAVAVAAGTDHAVALLEDGTLRGWGIDSRSVSGLVKVSGVQQVVAGHDYTAWLDAEGFLHVEAGDDSEIGSVDRSEVAYGELVAGSDALVGRRLDSGVWVVIDGKGRSVPKSDSVLANLRELTIGSIHGAGINATGQGLVGWGDGTYGQSTPPAQLPSVIRSIVAGRFHTIALGADNSVIAWGAGSAGSGSWPNFGQSVVPSGLQAAQVSAGSWHSVALRHRAPELLSALASESIHLGQSATFSVVVDGVAPIQYVWKKNGTVIPGQVGNSFRIASAVAADAANYSVTVTTPFGSISSEAELSVILPPTLTLTPATRTVNQGSSQTLSVSPLGTGPFTYQWLLNNDPISGATSDSYAIKQAAAGDGGVYKVRITGPGGTIVSTVATVGVVLSPTFVKQPAGVAVVLGKSAALSATAAGTAPLSYQWQKLDSLVTGRWQPVTGATGPQLALDNAQTSVGGTYRLLVVNGAGSATSAEVVVQVIVPAAPASPDILVTKTLGGTAQSVNLPVLAEGVPRELTGEVDSILRLSAAYTGTDPVQFQWLRNGVAISGARSSTLQLPPLDSASKQDGLYQVRLFNGAGPALATTGAGIRVTTLGIPRLSVNPPAQITAQFGNNVNLMLETVGVLSSVTWFKDGGQLTVGPGTRYELNGASLAVFSVETGDAGVYQAVLANASGKLVTPAIRLKVTGTPPKITSQPVGAVLLAGSSHVLSVAATGPAGVGLAYQWYLNGAAIAGATSATHSIQNLGVSNSGDYTVRVLARANGAVVSVPASVRTVSQPVVTRQPFDQNVVVGGSAQLIFKVQGDASSSYPMSYQWYNANGVIPENTAGVSGQRTDTLSVTHTEIPIGGIAQYYCIAQNAAGRVISAPAQVLVLRSLGDVAVNGETNALQTIELVPGWNAIHLEVEPSDNAVESVFSGVPWTSVWRFKNQRQKVEFIQDMSEASANTDRWLARWPQMLPDIGFNPHAFDNSLIKVSRDTSYLVHVGGTNHHTLKILGGRGYRPVNWVSDSYNLTGLPIDSASVLSSTVALDNANPAPDTSQEPQAGGGRDYLSVKDVIGVHPELWDSKAEAPRGMYRLTPEGSWTAMAAGDPVRPGEAYWILSRGRPKGTGSFHLELDYGESLDFPDNDDRRTLKLTNSKSTATTVRIQLKAPGSVSLESLLTPTNDPDFGTTNYVAPVKPANQPTLGVAGVTNLSPIEVLTPTVAGRVPINLALSSDITLAPGEVRVITLVANRSSVGIGGWKNLLVFSDGVTTYQVPSSIKRANTLLTGKSATKRKGNAKAGSVVESLKYPGLWLGRVSLTGVSTVNQYDTVRTVKNFVDDDGVETNAVEVSYQSKTNLTDATPVAKPLEFNVLVHVDNAGKAKILQEVYLMQAAPSTNGNPGEFVLITDRRNLTYFRGTALRGRERGGRRLSSLVLGLSGAARTNGYMAMDGSLIPGSKVSVSLGLDPRSPVNPFLHKYHPDHDNLTPDFKVYKEEAYGLTREISIDVNKDQDGGGRNGAEIMKGVYSEVIRGLHRNAIRVEGPIEFLRVSDIGVLNPPAQ